MSHKPTKNLHRRRVDDPENPLNEYGLPCILVFPTELDKVWRFDDRICETDDDAWDRTHYPPDKRTALQRLAESLRGTGFDHCDSKTVGVQCFNDGRWPERSDLLCWWCLHKFDTRPFPCPVRYNAFDGKYTVRGVFCGPSCAKAWAIHDGKFTNIANVIINIDMLAAQRGYAKGGKMKWVHVSAAPPRQCLQIFIGEDGMTIEQFRGLCARCFDVQILNPPMISQKQIIEADYRRLVHAISKERVCQRETIDTLGLAVTEVARMKREGLKIFAGIGVKRLSDFFPTTDGSTRKTGGAGDPRLKSRERKKAKLC